MAASSHTLTKKQHDYLLPVFGIPAQNKMLVRGDNHYFIGTHAEYLDALNRCRYLN